jgi:hypothetical protein
MRAARLLTLMFVVSLGSPALAQDDLLAPLSPPAKKSKAAKKKKKKAPARSGRKAAQEDEFLAPLVAKTELAVKVAGGLRARVFIDGKEAGFSAGEPFELSPGAHTVVVKRPGYADAIREVTAKEGERTELAVNLDAVAGVLTVLASVPSAKVFLDGSFEGSVPLRELLVAPGSHEVRVSADGHQSVVERILVKAGKDYTVNAELRRGSDPVRVASSDRPSRTELDPDALDDEDLGPVPLVGAGVPEAKDASGGAWYQRWYVWAGAGAVVAGAVATGMIVANSGPDLTQSPTTVCGGPCAGVLVPALR